MLQLSEQPSSPTRSLASPSPPGQHSSDSLSLISRVIFESFPLRNETRSAAPYVQRTINLETLSFHQLAAIATRYNNTLKIPRLPNTAEACYPYPFHFAYGSNPSLR